MYGAGCETANQLMPILTPCSCSCMASQACTPPLLLLDVCVNVCMQEVQPVFMLFSSVLQIPGATGPQLVDTQGPLARSLRVPPLVAELAAGLAPWLLLHRVSAVQLSSLDFDALTVRGFCASELASAAHRMHAHWQVYTNSYTGACLTR